MDWSVELALRALNDRYFSALDQQDLARVGEAFAVDARATYLGGEWVMDGRAQIIEKLEAIRRFESSVHVVGNAVYRPGDGDSFAGTLFVIAHLSTGGASPKLLVRGLRYEDVYTLSPGGALIVAREQFALWQYEVTATSPSIDRS